MENFLGQLRGASLALVGPSLDFQKLSIEVAEDIVRSRREKDGPTVQQVAAEIRRPAYLFPFASPPDMERLLNEIRGLPRGAKTRVMIDGLSPAGSPPNTWLDLTPDTTRDQTYLQVQGNAISTHGIQLSVKEEYSSVVRTVAFCLHILDPEKAIDHALALFVSLRTPSNTEVSHTLDLGAYSILGGRSVTGASLYFQAPQKGDTREFSFSHTSFEDPDKSVTDMPDGEAYDYDPEAKNYAMDTLLEVYQQLRKYLRTLLS